ncbi:hypothetical protein ACWCQV_33740, partial [Streptomyces eurythermus]
MEGRTVAGPHLVGEPQCLGEPPEAVPQRGQFEPEAVQFPLVPAGADPEAGAAVLKFASCIIPKAIDAMRYDWDRAQGRFSFF